ncbi:putative addiction module antidote protein [Rhizobium sp. TH2]|uniref:addiction module antidote protein n=1 Tax=Rhizobium sp. TH2 TaxID=2775403 RepID=UPI002156F75B|nr:addiction module antidote protein [Rhizobium sp. TH2]UVC10096.1 putative addiction module antidote protein [Rhizobium sp. TH2]
MQTIRFDASEFLDDEEVIAEYLAAAMEDDNPEVFIAALGDVAKARGISEIARSSGLGRESLYKSLRPGSKLRFETMRKIVDTMGLKLTIEPATRSNS